MRTYSVWCGKCLCGRKFETRDPLFICEHCHRLIELEWPGADQKLLAENKRLIEKRLKRELVQLAEQRAVEKAARDAVEAVKAEERNKRVWEKMTPQEVNAPTR